MNVKSATDEFPAIAVNEFVCMRIGREAEFETPEFWLSDDGRLFIRRCYCWPPVLQHWDLA
jgi:serine/threonine-protein kinase HipA